MTEVRKDISYRLESILSVHKVQCPKEQPALSCRITLRPAFSQEIPFRLELSAELASKASLQSSQKHDNCIFPWGLRQFVVDSIIELERRGGQRFGTEVAEAVAVWFFGCKSSKW